MAVGSIMTEGQAKQAILNDYRNISGSRTFGSMYAANELAGMRAEQQVEQQYGEQIGQAYKSAMAQRSNILSSNLGTGYKESMLGDTDQYLTQAYNQYMSKLSESKQEIASNVAKANKEVTSIVDTIAKNKAAYGNALFDYYDAYLAERQNTLDEDSYKKFMRSALWDKYYTYDFGTDTQAKADYDVARAAVERGEMTEDELFEKFWQYRRAKTRDELTTVAYDEVDGRKEYSSLYDEEGNLTLAGVDFFDQLENFAATRKNEGQSWSEYLQSTNPELYDWASSYNPYNVGPDDMTYAGSFRTMTGRTSTDYTYSFLERFGGLTEEQTKSAFSKVYEDFNKKASDININDIDSMLAEFEQISKEIGLTQDAINWTGIRQQVSQYVDEAKQAHEDAKDSKTENGLAIGVGILAVVAGGIVTGASFGTATAAGVAIAGAGLAGITAGIANMDNITNAEEREKAYKKAAQNEYLRAVTAMVNKLQYERRQAQINQGF